MHPLRKFYHVVIGRPLPHPSHKLVTEIYHEPISVAGYVKATRCENCWLENNYDEIALPCTPFTPPSQEKETP